MEAGGAQAASRVQAVTSPSTEELVADYLKLEASDRKVANEIMEMIVRGLRDMAKALEEDVRVQLTGPEALRMAAMALEERHREVMDAAKRALS